MNDDLSPNPKLNRRFGVLYFVVYLSLLLHLICTTFTNADETANIVSGLSIWKTGVFDLYTVNPPLVKTIAAAPLTLCRAEVDWKEYERQRLFQKPGVRKEFSMAIEFAGNNAERLRGLLILARLACVPFALLGAYYSWRLASEMFGAPAGAVSAILWAFCPNLLTWGTFVLSDMAASTMGVVLSYYFWRWLKAPQWNETWWLGVLLGVALLTKFTCLILFVLLPVQWLLWIALHRENRRVPPRNQIARLAVVFLTGAFVVNLGYFFEGSLKPLGDYEFVSRTLAGSDSLVDGGSGGNRFASSWLGKVPVPVPQNYLEGIDLQKVDFEIGLPSYLNGEWSNRGWLYFYLECALLKTPLGAWLLALVATITVLTAFFKNRRLVYDGNCLYLFLFGGVFFAFVSSQTGFSRHFRYVLPSLPFFYIGTSSVFSRFKQRSKLFKAVLSSFLVWFAASSLWVYPHCMSYFNELVGGPRYGSRFLFDSNIDWGQDTWRMRRWLDRRGRNDVGVKARDTLAEVYLQDRNYPGVPKLIDQELHENHKHTDYFQQDPLLLGPRPGLYAVSVQQLYEENGNYRYFNDLEPVLRFGYSIYLYDVSWDDAGRLREKYRLPPLERPDTNLDAFLRERVARADKKRQVRVAYVRFARADEGAFQDFQRALSDDSFTLEILLPRDVRDGALESYDLVLIPGGSATSHAEELGYVGAKAVRDFVRSGGGYLGVCAGAFLGSSRERYPLRLANVRPQYVKRDETKLVMENGPKLCDPVDLTLTSAGAAALNIDDRGALRNVVYTGGPIFNRDYQQDLPDVITIANFASNLHLGDRRKQSEEAAIAITLSPFGAGAVCLCSPHIEKDASFDNFLRRLVYASARDQ